MTKGTANGEANSLAYGIEEKLERRYGLGSKPDSRRAFYRRLRLAVEIHGERAWIALRTVAAEADGARLPERYFCRTALARLRESGLMPMADL